MSEIKANMAGSISQILIKENDFINEGEELFVLESMKMHIPVRVERSGTVRTIHVREGDFVNDGDLIATID